MGTSITVAHSLVISSNNLKTYTYYVPGCAAIRDRLNPAFGWQVIPEIIIYPAYLEHLKMELYQSQKWYVLHWHQFCRDARHARKSAENL